MYVEFGEELLNAHPDKHWSGFCDDGGRVKVMDRETGREKAVEPEDEGELAGACECRGNNGQAVYLVDGLDATTEGDQ